MRRDQCPIGQDRQQQRADQSLHLVAQPADAVMDEDPLAAQRRRIAQHRPMQQRVAEQQRADGRAVFAAVVGFVGDGGGVDHTANITGGRIVLPIEMTGTANVGVVTGQAAAVDAGLVAVPRGMVEEDDGAQMEG